MKNELLSNLSPEGIKAILDYAYDKLEILDDQQQYDKEESEHYNKERAYWLVVAQDSEQEFESKVKHIFP